MITITGGTGNIGMKLAMDLITKGIKVRVVARNEERMKSLSESGAELFKGDLVNADLLTRAFRGAKSVFTMIPPNNSAADFRAYQNSISKSIANAIKNSEVRHVVNLSSVGAHLSEKAGPVNGLFDHEERLNKIPNVNILHLRPTYFMENLLWNIDLIKRNGICGSPLKPDVSMSMIATRDISSEAAHQLIQLGFSNKSAKELLGQRDLTMTEATRVIGKAIGKPDLPYIQFPYDEAEKAMVGMGLSPDYARLLIEMNRSWNEGLMKPTEERSIQNTTSTSIEEFAKTYAILFNR